MKSNLKAILKSWCGYSFIWTCIGSIVYLAIGNWTFLAGGLLGISVVGGALCLDKWMKEA